MQNVIEWCRLIGWNGFLLGLLLVLMAIILAVFVFCRKKDVVVQEITLHELSNLWTREGRKTIHISELSPLWRAESPPSQADTTIKLQDSRAAAFMKNIVGGDRFKMFPQHRVVCEQLLLILDKQGHCPSVVDVHGDVEGGWDENTYQLLAKTNLLDHSLNVAEEAVQLLSAGKAWHVIPDTMIAALAHDLGKLESIRGYLYSLGEHPLAGCRPLTGIPEFEELPKKEEILQAVKLHHKKPQGLLGKTLKKADQKARQKELDQAVLINDTEKVEGKNSPPEASKTKNTDNDSAWRAQADIYNEAGQTHTNAPAPPQLMDISAWFDTSLFLAELKPYINKMFGRRFMAFSMSDGHVYFQVKVLEEVARRMAEKAGCMEIATMAPKDESMRDVLLTIVHQLRSEQDIIARGLIKDTFFGGYFTVTRKIGKNIKGYYTPFHAEPFGSIAEMENNKPQMLKDIVKVSPYLDDSRENDNQ